MSPDESAIYRDAAARLLATGLVDFVNLDGDVVGPAPGTTALGCFAHLRPGRAEVATDFLPSTTLRKVAYRVELVRTPAADMADDAWYHRVASAARSALSAVSLAGVTAPGLTRVADDAIAKDGGPSTRVANTFVLDGTFTYPIPAA